MSIHEPTDPTDRAGTPDGTRRRQLPYGLLTASALAVVILAIALVMAFSSDDGGDDAQPTTTLPGGSTTPLVAEDVTGEKLPTLELETFDGGSATFAELTGKPMVVNFFASWCTPCIKEMPAFEEVHQDLGDEVTFVGVNSTDRLEDGERIVEQTGVTYALLRDESGDALAAIGGTGMPTTLFVDADGTIVDVRARELSADQLREALATELGVDG